MQEFLVGVATDYMLHGPEIESRWGREFLHPFGLPLRATQSLIQWVPGLLPRGKAAEEWRSTTILA
jgi:hypothetical protein